MSGFTGNYYWRVPNVNRSRIPVRTLGTIQEGGQPGGFNMYNTSTIIQIPTSTQTTTPIVPTGTQPTSTQTTTPPISITTQTTTPQVPVSNVTTLSNILQTTTTPVGTTTGQPKEEAVPETLEIVQGDLTFSITYMEIPGDLTHHEAKDLDSIIPKIYHQDLEEALEEVSEEETQEDHQEDQEDHQEEVVTQEIITQVDW